MFLPVNKYCTSLLDREIGWNLLVNYTVIANNIHIGEGCKGMGPGPSMPKRLPNQMWRSLFHPSYAQTLCSMEFVQREEEKLDEILWFPRWSWGAQYQPWGQILNLPRWRNNLVQKPKSTLFVCSIRQHSRAHGQKLSWPWSDKHDAETELLIYNVRCTLGLQWC